MKKRSISLLLALIIFTLLFGACASNGPEKATEASLREISLPVGYIPNVQFAPLYVAMEKGYFKDAGVNVKIDYSFETDALALVGAGKLEFALVSGEQVLLGRAQQLPVVNVLAWYQKYPVGIASLKSAGIAKPEDLRGKRIGTPVLSGASYVGMEALLAAGDLKDADVQIDTIGFNQVESLVTGREDAVVVYVANEPVQLKAQGYDVDVLLVSDYLTLVSNGLITSEKMLIEEPELVRGVVNALLKGIQDAIADPDGAYEICKKYVENLDNADETTQKAVLTESIKLWQGEKLGFSQPEAWVNMQEVLLKIGLIQEELDLERAYSNEFIP